MKNILGICVLASSMWAMTACSSSSTKEEELKEEKEEVVDFYKGADISWVTEMESKGHQFYNNEGQARECTALMKEYGMNAIRLRVWVDPSKHDNWCNKEDVLVKAKRAKALGMRGWLTFIIVTGGPTLPSRISLLRGKDIRTRK